MTIRAACSPGEVRVAVADEGGLLDYAIWRPGRPDGVGDVHRGRVTVVLAGMAGVFVSLAGVDGFLPDSAGGAGRGVGDAVAVRVVRAAQGGKGPRLAVVDEDVGAGPPGLVRAGPNPVVRLAALHAGPVLVDDPAVAAVLRGELGGRLSIGAAWDDELEAAVDALASSMVRLPGRLVARIEPTAALVAIDLDTGESTAGRDAKRPKQEAANRAALPALARQIRLRNLSGAILIDLAGVSQRRRREFAPAIAEALAADPLGPRLLGFTPGGLAEIHRPRVHAPLHEVLRGPHAAGLAALRRIAAEPVRPPALVAAPDVACALDADFAATDALAHRLGRALVMRSDPALPPGTWLLEHPARG